MDFKFSSDVEFPDTVKVRKRFPGHVFNLIVGCNYHRVENKVSPKLYLEDVAIKGRVGFDIGQKQISYRAICGLPIVGNLELYAAYNFDPDRPSHSFGVQFATSPIVALLNSGTMSYKQRIPVNKRLQFEVCGDITRPGLGAQMNGGGFQLGNGPLGLHFKQVNPVIHL